MGISSSAQPANRSTPTVPQSCWVSRPLPNGTAGESGWTLQLTRSQSPTFVDGCNARNDGFITSQNKTKSISSCSELTPDINDATCWAASYDLNPPKTPTLGKCFYRLDSGSTYTSNYMTKAMCDSLGRTCVKDNIKNRYCTNWCDKNDPNCKDTVTPISTVPKGRCWTGDVGKLIQREELTEAECNSLTSPLYCIPANNGPNNGLSIGCSKWCAYADQSCPVPVYVSGPPPPVGDLARLPTASDIQDIINAAASYQNAFRTSQGLPPIALTTQQNLLACTAETARIDAQYNIPYIEPKDSSKQVGHYRFDVLTNKVNYPCIPSTSDGSENSGYMQYNNALDGSVRITTFNQVAKLIIEGFQNSQRHRENLLKRAWNMCSIGVYCWKQPSGNYFCWLVCDYFTASSEPQPTKVDCIGDWQLGSCNRSCGGGQQTDTFRVSRPASNGGVQCAFNDGQIRTNSCNTQPCPVNCVGNWQNGTCSRSCGGGTQTDVYRISQQASGGGAACSFGDGQTRTNSCNNQPCPVDCQGAWSRGACDCRGGQPESYYITQSAANGGAPCPYVQGTTRTVQTGCVCGNNLYYAKQGTYDWTMLKQNANDADLQWAKNQYPSYCCELATTKPTKLCPAPSTGGSTANLYYTGNGNSNWTLFQSNVPQSSQTQYQAQYPNYCWVWSKTQPTSRCTLGSAPAPSVATANIYSSNPGESVWYLREYQVPQSRLQYWQSNYAGQCWVWSSTQPTNVCALAGGNTGFGNIYWATKGQSQWTMYMDSALQSDLSKYKLQYPNYCWQWVSNSVQPNTPTNLANC